MGGDLGSTVGSIYRSLTGFHRWQTKSAGEIQIVLTAALLHKMGFAWIDLGHTQDYKTRLGAHIMDRDEFRGRLLKARDKNTKFGHERIEGDDLLCYLQMLRLEKHNNS